MQRTARKETGEVIVPFFPDREHARVATHIRSTMITSSVASLRTRGLYDAYCGHLPAARRVDMPATVAGSWLPLSEGLMHYGACNALRLPAAELIEIGADAASRSTNSMLSVVKRLAAGGGVTPWTILGQTRRLWERAFQGSSVGVFKIGPKEARFEIIAWPLAGIEYNRVSFRGILRSLLASFCTQVYVHEATSLCTPMSIGYRIAWA